MLPLPIASYQQFLSSMSVSHILIMFQGTNCINRNNNKIKINKILLVILLHMQQNNKNEKIQLISELEIRNCNQGKCKLLELCNIGLNKPLQINII